MPTSHRKTILPQLKERKGCSPRPLTQKRKEHRKQPLVVLRPRWDPPPSEAPACLSRDVRSSACH